MSLGGRVCYTDAMTWIESKRLLGWGLDGRKFKKRSSSGVSLNESNHLADADHNIKHMHVYMYVCVYIGTHTYTCAYLFVIQRTSLMVYIVKLVACFPETSYSLVCTSSVNGFT